METDLAVTVVADNEPATIANDVLQVSRWVPFITSTHSVSNERTLRFHLFLSGEDKSLCNNMHISKMAREIPAGMTPKYCSVCIPFTRRGQILTDSVLAEIIVDAESARTRYRCNLAEHLRLQARTKEEISDSKRRMQRKKLLARHNITIEAYEKMVEQQDNKCAVCRKSPEVGKNLDVDHDHSTGAVRGLLCNKCNTAIARLGDSVSGIQRVLDYLKR